MTQNSALPDRHYREDICGLFQIGKDTYYKRVKFLDITAHRDENKKTYLDNEQLQRLRDLDSHIANTGKMEGFVIAKNDESEALVRATEDAMLQGNGSMGAMEREPADLVGETIYVEPEEPTSGMDIDELMRQAAELKARNLAMPELVKLSIARDMTFEDLPPDLQGKVTAAREAANPKEGPASIASNLLAQYRSNRSGKP